jgi:prepilin-type N-terminal cleavage/methylation domain-containing protein
MWAWASDQMVGDQRGMTLVELVVAMAITTIAMVVFGTVLASVQRSTVKADSLSRANDQARLAIEQLDRELRSGNVIYDPSTETPAYYRLRVWTQSNQTTRNSALCELWEITSGGIFRVRTWKPGVNAWLTDWRVVAEHVVNQSVGKRAFQMNPAPGNRTVDIDLVVNPDYVGDPGQTIEIRSSLTGRNTSYNYPTSVCSTLPPG